MISKKVTVINKSGLHLRPASLMSQIASNCSSEIEFIKGEKVINPKSVLMLMAGGIMCGDEIEIRCEGEHEAEDMNTLVEAINSGLGE